MATVLADVVQMAKRSLELEKQLMNSDGELQNTQRELQIVSRVALEAHHLALGKWDKARSCLQQPEGVEKKLHLARERVTGFEGTSAETAV